MTHEYLMNKGDPPTCLSCGTTIKHILKECRMYAKQREDLNISNQIGASLGPNPNSKTDTIKFLKTIKLVKPL